MILSDTMAGVMMTEDPHVIAMTTEGDTTEGKVMVEIDMMIEVRGEIEMLGWNSGASSICPVCL